MRSRCRDGNSDDKPGGGGRERGRGHSSRAGRGADAVGAGRSACAGSVRVTALAADTGTNPGCFSAVLPRRLTRTQFVNVLDGLVGNADHRHRAAGARIRTLVTDKAQYPQDASINPETTRHQGYWRLDPTVTTRQVGGINTVGPGPGRRPRQHRRPRRRRSSAAARGDACLTAFIRKAGRTLFRQPLTDAEVAVYRKVANGATDRAALVKVLATMIASPQTYFVRGTRQWQRLRRLRAAVGPRARHPPVAASVGHAARRHARRHGRRRHADAARRVPVPGHAPDGRCPRRPGACAASSGSGSASTTSSR